ncbi:hypothetical protein X777_08632 [Ooceraea biroi]|uniref:Mutator-like transposase domain-containing protein n=1 Tax=Ooceraea biroi TaxID=2015173 RepID=A0A026WBS2_OOCBI|nr:hypothetical protein X777_08632 [Ooceraea biroi]
MKSNRTFDNHVRGIECQFKDWKLIDSYRRGLKTQLFFKCQMCHYEDTIWSEPTESHVLDIYTAAAAGTITMGIGYAQLEEFCAAVSIPCMFEKTYIDRRNTLVDDFLQTAMQSMKMAGEEKKRLAIERNETINSIPYITVVADGSWIKRSYGSVYDSSSGIGAIISYRTGKVLFVGIRNKYCALCDMAEHRGLKARKHKCYKNFDHNASSTKMESDAIVESFQSSLKMHGVIYKILIADGDSSVYNSIRHNAPYREMNVVVQKIECTNHLLRNLCKKLKAVARTTAPKTMHRKRDFVQLRKVVDNNILEIRKEVLRLATVRRRGTQAQHKKALELQKDILNIPSHIFGEHKRCRERGVYQDLCNNVNNYVPSLKHCGLFEKIDSVIRFLSTCADSLLLNVTNNPAELFNSIICKEIGGKRIHFGKRGSYNARIAGSVVQYNTQQVLTELHKSMCKDVSAVVADLEKRQQIKIARNKERTEVYDRKRFKRDVGPDSHYGPHSQKPDLPPHVFQQLQQHHAGVDYLFMINIHAWALLLTVLLTKTVSWRLNVLSQLRI